MEGQTYVVATGWGIARCDAERQEVHRFNPMLRRNESPADLDVFAVLDAEARRTLFRRRGERLSTWSVKKAGSTVEACEGPDVHAAVRLGDDRLLVAVSAKEDDGRERIGLFRATVSRRTLSLDERIELPEAPRVRLNSSELFSPDFIWHEDSDDEELDEFGVEPNSLGLRSPPPTNYMPGRVRLLDNRYGIALTSTYNGLVAVLDRKTLEPRLLLRVPWNQEQFELFALPVSKGVLITLCANDRQSEFVAYTHTGKIAAIRTELGKALASGASSAGIAWTDKQIRVSNGGSCYSLTFPGLKPKLLEDQIVVDHTTSADGSSHLVATEGSSKARPGWSLHAHRKDGRKWMAHELAMPDFTVKQEVSLAAFGLERATGRPTLQLASDRSTAWSVQHEQETELRFKVGNRGGPLAGVTIEVGGPAVSGKNAILAVTNGSPLDGDPVPFGDKLRVTLPALTIAAGFVDDGSRSKKNAPQPPSAGLVLRVRGAKIGAALLTVRVTPLDAGGTTGSAMQGSTFKVQP